MRKIAASKQPVHPSIARFLGRYGKIVESWERGFNIQKLTLNGRAFYAYRYGTDPDDGPQYLLRVSFGSHLMLRGDEFRGELFYQAYPVPERLDFDAAASAYEAALYLSGNLPIASPMPRWIQRGIPEGLEMSQFAALDALATSGYEVGWTTFDIVQPQRHCFLVQGDIKRARPFIAAAFGPAWKTTPEINSRNVVISPA